MHGFQYDNVHHLLQISSFSTEKDHDFLTVRSGGPTEDTSTEIASLSGTLSPPPGPYYSINHFMLLQFTSDSDGQENGFEATWSIGRSSSDQHDSKRIAFVRANFTMLTSVDKSLSVSLYTKIPLVTIRILLVMCTNITSSMFILGIIKQYCTI